MGRAVTTYRRATDPTLTFDPATVAPFTLPDLFTGPDGVAVTDPHAWQTRRRPQLLEAFTRHIYGRTPAAAVPVRFELVRRDADALDGTATRGEIACLFGTGRQTVRMALMVYTPNSASGPVPAFLGLNFWGNHSIDADPAIALHAGWMPNRPDKGVVNHAATDAGRGCMAHRWPLKTIIDRGYALATACYRDLDPDNEQDQSFTTGIYPLLDTVGPERDPDQWGSIGAWAWGLSRALDFLVTDPAIDHHRVAVCGHSRLGKAALWAAAQDTRFAMTISNDSGCGGASLVRHTLGERLHVLARLRPYWFAPAFAHYQHVETALPVDQHMLLALLAPRPIYVASATEDYWADPLGEYLALRAATPAYTLHGIEATMPGTPPQADRPLIGHVSYHLRSGRHDLTEADWRGFLAAADRHLVVPPRTIGEGAAS
jgi:hypothetical protein